MFGRSKIRMRAKSNFLNQFKLIWVVQSPAKKHFAFHPHPAHGFLASSRLTQRDVRVVTDVETGCDGRFGGALTNDA